jgi:hypothetical protein
MEEFIIGMNKDPIRLVEKGRLELSIHQLNEIINQMIPNVYQTEWTKQSV